MKSRNWGARLKALVLVAVTMFTLTATALADHRFIENISSTNMPYVDVYLKKGEYCGIINCGEKSLQIYNGPAADGIVTPHRDSLYRAPKKGTYRFQFQTTNGGTTYVQIAGGRIQSTGSSTRRCWRANSLQKVY